MGRTVVRSLEFGFTFGSLIPWLYVYGHVLELF